MSEYISAKEIVQMKISWLPRSVKGVIEKAKRENWACRKRQGRGGGFEYLIDALPPDLRAALDNQRAKALLKDVQKDIESTGLSVFAAQYPEVKAGSPAARRLMATKMPPADIERGLTDKQRRVAYARLTVVREVMRLKEQLNVGMLEVINLFIEKAENGLLPAQMQETVNAANARSGSSRTLGKRTLHGWINAVNNTGRDEVIAVLAPKVREKRDFIDIDWLPDFMSCYCNPNKPTLAAAYRKCLEIRTAAGAPLPGIDAVKRVFNRLPVVMQERGRNTGAAYTAILPYVQRDWLKLAPNNVWVGDGHSFKAKVRHPVHGRPFKPEVTVIIDALRYVVGFSVSLAESTQAVADALRDAMKNNGIPLIYYSDNGGGQTAKVFDDAVTGMFSRIGISHMTGIPGNPQGRGVIERWWANLIQLAKTYPTYVGKDADSSTKNLQFRKMESAFNALAKGGELTDEQRATVQQVPDWQQFIADVAAKIEEYNHTPHKSLPKKPEGGHYSPAEYRAARLAAENLILEMPTELELNMMQRPEIVRKVRRGLVELFGQSYFSVELANFHGQDVRVRYDIHEWEHVQVFDANGKFICTAAFEGNKRAAVPETQLERAQRIRSERRLALLEEQAELAKAEMRQEVAQPDFDLLIEKKPPLPAADIGALLDKNKREPKKYKFFNDDF